MKGNDKPRILFIGGTGTISTAVTALLSKHGADLYLFNRGTKSDTVPAGVKIITGDIRDTEAAGKALDGFTFDVVVDWIAFTPEHVRNDIRLFGGKVKQYVFISSASAYEKPPSCYLIRETTPLVNPYWQYSRDKAECEKILMDEYHRNSFPCTIVRPSYTYSNTIPFVLNSKTYPWTVIDRMLRGKKIIVPGDGTSLWTLTHAEDFASGFTALLGNREAIGEAFHITSDEVLTWDQITYTIAGKAGVKPDIAHIASDFICFHEPEYTGGLLGDKAVSVVFDNSKIKKFAPGFSAKIPFSEGIGRSIEWFRSHPELCGIDENFNHFCDKLIDAYSKGLVKQ